jgi:hypothetical protein
MAAPMRWCSIDALYSLTGTPDECVTRAMDYADAGIDELALTFDGVAPASDIALPGDALKHHLH